MNNRYLAAFWMLVAAIATATMAACVRAVKQHVDWHLVTLVRTTVGLAVAVALLRMHREKFPWRAPRHLWIRSASGAVAFVCTFYAVSHIPVADALVLLNTTPLWVALVAAVVFGQRLSSRSAVAIVVATIGVVVIARPHFAQRNLGALAGIASGVLGSVSVLAIARTKGVSPTGIVAHATAGAVLSSVVSTILSPVHLDWRFLRSPTDLALLGAIALLGTTAQIGTTRAYATAGGTRFAALAYTTVAFGAAFDYALFRHALEWPTLVGILLIVVPAVWIVLASAAPGDLRHRHVAIEFGESPGEAFSLRERLSSIEKAVVSAELLTSCEVRVHVDRRCDAPKRVPGEVFQRLGIAKTKDRNGVLVYLAIETRTFAVVVDDGIADAVPTKLLDRLCDEITADMQRGDPVAAMADGIVRLLGALGTHFPRQHDDVNELPDAVSFGSDI